MVGMLADVPELLSGGGVDKAYSALFVPYLHAEENLKSGVVGVDVGYDGLVGMAYAGAPQGLAVVVNDHGSEHHLLSAVIVKIHAHDLV